jgi:hypothetical protein
MRQLRGISLLAVLAALSGTCFATGQAIAASPSQGQTPQGAATTPPAQGLPSVCLDVQTGDKLMEQFADRVRQTISASGALSVGSNPDACKLQLHIPGNLLRFQTAGGVMVSTVVIVTSPSGRYLSTSITACEASDLEPCAVRAVAAAKLALLMMTNDGT